MKKISLIIALAFLLPFISAAQSSNFVQHEGIKNKVHEDNVGKITFMAKPIAFEQYSEKDFLQTFELNEKCDFNARVFLANSLTNYLHDLAPNLSAEELTTKGNYQFNFYIDNQFIYTENLNVGAGSSDSKNTKLVFRIPFISSTNEDHWGRFLWNRFLMKGGLEALSEGTHNLKIELRAYILTSKLKVSEKIAEGQIQIIIPEKKLEPKLIEVQKIKPTTDWAIANNQVNEEKIKALNKKILTSTYKDITSIVVIKDNKLVLEEYFNKAKRNTLHDTRSVGKSFTSALLGIAIQDSLIKNENQNLSSFYNLKMHSNFSAQKENISLKNLLTMSSCIDGSDRNEKSPGNEENMYPTKNWVQFGLDLPVDSNKTNGKQWDYFTTGVVLLGDIIHKSAPQGLESYAKTKLFQPLGISKYKWEYTPQKVANTAGGIKLSSLDLAKFGQLYQNKGKWNGKEIIPASWIEKSLSHQVQITDAENEFYGFLFWNKTYTVNGKNYEVYYASGNGGNKIVIFKDFPFVMVITSKAFNTPYGHSQSDKIIQNYLIPALISD